MYRKSTDLFQFAKFARILQWSLFEIPAVAVVLVMQFAIVFMYAYSRNLLEMFVENNVGYPIISMTPKAESDLERNEYWSDCNETGKESSRRMKNEVQ